MDLGRNRSNLKIAWEKIMSKNSITPIKFKSFLNHWSYTRLKEVKDVRDGTHSSPKYIDNGYPLVTSKNLTDSGLNLNDVSLISESDYNEINKRSKVEVGDILLGLIGTIGKPVLVEIDGFSIKNVGLIKNGGKIQNQFLLQYLKTNLFNKYIQIEMAGNTQKFLGLETLRNTKVPVPSPEEQSAIGSLFRTLDDLLSSYKDNLANYQSLKATMLSKMIPKAGQTVPEIRLDGFEGEWEIKKFKSISTKRGKSNSKGYDYPAYSVSNQSGLIPQSEQFEGSRLGNLEKTSYKIVEPNEFAYNPARINVGSIAFNDLDETVIVSSLYVIFSLDKSINNNYALLFINSPEFNKEVRRNTEGSVREYLFYENFANIRIPIPPTFEEQCFIGSYFSNLDNLINSHQEKISQLETFKKKLLQDMFI